MIPDHDVFRMTPVLDKEQKLIEFPSKHSSRRPLNNKTYNTTLFLIRIVTDCLRETYVPGTCTGAYKSLMKQREII